MPDNTWTTESLITSRHTSNQTNRPTQDAVQTTWEDGTVQQQPTHSFTEWMSRNDNQPVQSTYTFSREDPLMTMQVLRNS